MKKKLGSASLVALFALLATVTAAKAQEHQTKASHRPAATALHQDMLTKIESDFRSRISHTDNQDALAGERS